MAREDLLSLVQMVGALLLTFAALGMAGWMESSGHPVQDWHKGLLVAATTYFFTQSRAGRK